MRTTQVECLVFRKNNNLFEFLLLKRIPKKGGFWQPITGGFEKKDNTLINTALRELKEEANIHPKDIQKTIEKVHYFEMTNHYLTNKPIATIKEYVFAFEVKPNVKVKIDKNIYIEHEKIKWTSFEEAINLLKWNNNKIALKKLNKILTN